jgi:excinuclease ABC subunit A
MEKKKLIIRGAREHNLKNINLDLPRDKMIVITGISGSGKSSLAFDTIYAEGQRRYVESLSAYARQFLEQMEKPDVDYIEGLSPAISIDQKGTTKNPRSTVGTITEIYDYIRLLYARIGKPHCYKCGKKISQQSPQQIIDKVLELPKDTKYMILSPIVRGRKGEYKDLFDQIRRKGYVRVRVDDEIRNLEEEIILEKYKKHDIEIVIDRLISRPNIRKRVADSIETALRESDGIVYIQINGGENLVFSQKFVCLDCGTSFEELSPRMFSFNSPIGACKYCDGLGFKQEIDPDLVVPDKNLSLSEGAVKLWRDSSSVFYPMYVKAISKKYNFDLSTPFKDLSEDNQNIILYGSPGERVLVEYERHNGTTTRFHTRIEGVISNLERRYRETKSEYSRKKIEEYMSISPCPKCGGARLRPESLAVTIGEKNIYEITQMDVSKSKSFIENLKLTQKEKMIARRILKEIRERLTFMENVGLNYLTLDRETRTLSVGEAQRIRLATQIGTSLVGVLYILDEPSIGLHNRDNKRLLKTLKRLRDLGNTVIVVEHDRETINQADFIVDLGPGAGEHGGEVVVLGTLEDVKNEANSITGQYLNGKKKIKVPKKRRIEDKGKLVILGANEHNLKEIDVSFPLAKFICVTGVSGAGKSTLVDEILYRALMNKLYRKSKYKPGEHKGIEGLEKVDKVIEIDQSPIGRTPRSNPATYTGVFTPIREVFAETQEAKIRGYKKGRFSFNVKVGRCEACRGGGTIKIEMHFLPDIYITCDVCKGKRYNKETLDVTFKGKNISDVLNMSVEEALEFFKNIPRIKRRLKLLDDVGLGYIKLGQSATTLSGGEAQRVKLAKELSKIATGRTIYILDEPTTGLHFDDIKKLLNVLNRLVDKGNTVIVIEHNLDVIKTADYIIDLGPEGGDEGGQIVAEGLPEEVAKNPKSYTGIYLKELLYI